jgi:hypothetical protein
VRETWLCPDVLARKIADRRSRYAHTCSLMVGTAGILLHLANRLDDRVRVSPIALSWRALFETGRRAERGTGEGRGQRRSAGLLNSARRIC